MRIDDPLDDLLQSRSFVRVLRALSGLPDGFRASAREVARRAGITHPTASKVLASLREQGAVHIERTPRADLFLLNRDHVLVEHVDPLFSLEDGLRRELVSFLRTQLKRHTPFVTTALIFGSAAGGDMAPGSDIDLAVIIRPSELGELEAEIEPIEEATRRRFGNRLNIIIGAEPLQDLARPGRSGARLWRQILEDGIAVVGTDRPAIHA